MAWCHRSFRSQEVEGRPVGPQFQISWKADKEAMKTLWKDENKAFNGNLEHVFCFLNVFVLFFFLSFKDHCYLPQLDPFLCLSPLVESGV